MYAMEMFIHMRTNCAPLLTNLFLYSYEAEFIGVYQEIQKEARPILFHFPNIDDVLSQNK